jgi:branched-chain amino acid transport system substrate-binding protein
VAVLKDVKSDYSVGLAKFFKEGFTGQGGKIVGRKLQRRRQGFQRAVDGDQGGHPDGLFVPGYYTEVGLIALQARQLGITVPLFGGDGWESSVAGAHRRRGAGRRLFFHALFAG